MYQDLPKNFKCRIGRPSGTVWEDVTQPVCDINDIICAEFAKGGIHVSWLTDRLSNKIEKAIHKLLREVAVYRMKDNYPMLSRSKTGAPQVLVYDESLDMSLTISLEDFFHDFISDWGQDREFAVELIQTALKKATVRAANG